MARNWEEFFVEKILLIAAVSSVVIILAIIGFVVGQGYTALGTIGIINFVFGLIWNPDYGLYGIFPLIIGTLSVVAVSLLFAVPLSILGAMFLAEVAPRTMRRILRPTIQTLAGVLSVIYGFFGLIVLVPFMRTHFGGSGFSILTASLILTVMVLPTILSISEDALRSIPVEYKEASLGLGATHWQTIKNVIFPAAIPGVITGVILGMGRAIGETMAVLMVAGNVPLIPTSILSPVRTLTANIALEMGEATGLHYNALFATGIVLLVIIVILLLIVNWVNYRQRVTIGGGYL